MDIWRGSGGAAPALENKHWGEKRDVRVEDWKNAFSERSNEVWMPLFQGRLEKSGTFPLPCW